LADRTARHTERTTAYTAAVLPTGRLKEEEAADNTDVDGAGVEEVVADTRSLFSG